jgi:tyrosyl-tRNA synthetase
MLSKESVKNRHQREEGLSFCEFAYMLLQAVDYVVLYDRFGCRLQMGGSDQLGNILLGMDLISRMRNGDAYGLVSPLVETRAGKKFGKTEAGTIWLDRSLTTPFKFFQYLLNTPDSLVGNFLRYFTFLEPDEISNLEAATAAHPEHRESQRKLACLVTEMVHGPTDCLKAQRAADVLFGKDFGDLTKAELLEIFADTPSTTLPASWLDESKTAIDAVSLIGFVGSKSEARRLIQGGGLYVNNRRVSDLNTHITKDMTIDRQFIVLRKGPKHFHVIQFRN